MAYAYNTFDAWLVGHGFADYLDGTGELKDGTSQSFFSSQYTAWLNDLLAFYAEPIRSRYGLAPNTQLLATSNQNDPSGLPSVSGLTQAQVDQLFDDSSDFVWTSGTAKHLVFHTRYYSNSFDYAGLDANHAPTASAVATSGAEDSASIAVVLTGSDPDAGDAIVSFALASLPPPSAGVIYTDSTLSTAVVAGAAYAASGQSLTLYFVPAENFNGDVQFSYTAFDGEVASSQATATISVTQVNDPAIFSGDLSGSGDEDGGPIIGSLAVSDPADGMTSSNFRIEEGDGPGNGSAAIDAATGQWSYTPNTNFNGPDHFTVTVTDDDGNVETQVIDIAVSPVHHNGPMDFAILTFPASVNVSAGEGISIFGQVFDAGLTESPRAAADIVAQLGYGASGTDPTADQFWTWTNAFFNAQSGQNDEYVSTIDGSSLTPGNYAYTYRFGISVGGQTPVDWTYADLDGTANGFDFNQLGSMTVLSGGINHAPVAVNDFAQVFVGQEVNGFPPDQLGLLANDSDPDGDGFELIAINGDADPSHLGDFINLPSGARIQAFNDGAYDYIPDGQLNHLAQGESFVDTITYTIQDSHGQSSDGTLIITVNGVFPGPLALDDIAVTDEDTPLLRSGERNLLDNDRDFDGRNALSVAAVNGSEAAVNHKITLASGALLTVSSDGTYAYDPNGHFEFLQNGESASDSFQYSVANSAGVWANATATITISGVDEAPLDPSEPPNPHAPVAVNDFAQVFVDTEINGLPGTPFDLLANDSDPDGDGFELIAINGDASRVDTGQFITLPSGALIQAFSDGAYDYVPDREAFNLAPGENFIDHINYTIRDTTGLTSTGTLEVTVIAPGSANDAIDFATLESPTSLSIGVGQTSQVYGRVSEAGLTEFPGPSANLFAQLGIGSPGTDPQNSANWTWLDAEFNGQIGNGDGYVASTPDNLDPGAYAYAYRFGISTNGLPPTTWTYADIDGNSNGVHIDQLGSLFVL
jgi:VCBS repeat-containing protein